MPRAAVAFDVTVGRSSADRSLTRALPRTRDLAYSLLSQISHGPLPGYLHTVRLRDGIWSPHVPLRRIMTILSRSGFHLREKPEALD